jgi:hypothetical protein
MDKTQRRVEPRLSQVDQVCVVREEDHLRAPRQCGKNVQRRARALVVEAHEHVVDHKGHGLLAFEVVFQTGHAQGEVKLIGRAVAHRRQFDALPSAGPHPFEHDLALVVGIFDQTIERSSGKLPEELACAPQHVSLVLLAVAFDSFAQDGQGEPEADELGRIGLEPGQEVLHLLGALGGLGPGVHGSQRLFLAADRPLKLVAPPGQQAELPFELLDLAGKPIGVHCLGRGHEGIDGRAGAECGKLLVDRGQLAL